MYIRHLNFLDEQWINRELFRSTLIITMPLSFLFCVIILVELQRFILLYFSLILQDYP